MGREVFRTHNKFRYTGGSTRSLSISQSIIPVPGPLFLFPLNMTRTLAPYPIQVPMLHTLHT